MLRFLLYMGIFLGSLAGVVVAVASAIVLSTPDASNINECITATMYNVPLCPKSDRYVPLSRISPYVRHAVIVSEDSAFYQHNGLDLHELQQSFDENLKEGKFVRGGSTITQQLAKNVYLSGEKSLFRKAREALIAMQIEKTLSKDQILEKYLNVVEFGPEVYGVKQASQFYFGKDPSNLTVIEGAWLAFVLPNPKKYSQSYRKRELTKFARNQLSIIISRMGRFRKIPMEESDAALAQLDSMFKPTVDPLESLTPEEMATMQDLNAIETNLEPSSPPPESTEVDSAQPTETDAVVEEVDTPQAEAPEEEAN